MTPGAPPEQTQPPKPSTATRPSFSFLDLEFLGTDYQDHVRYIIFGTMNCVVKIKEHDYYGYMNHYFNMYDIFHIDKKEDQYIHDICNPTFTKEELPKESTLIDLETEKETTIFTYKVSNLIDNTVFTLLTIEND